MRVERSVDAPARCSVAAKVWRIWLRASRRHSPAFTLVEVIVAVALVGVLVALLVPAYLGVLANMKVDRAIAEITELQFHITNFRRDNERLPETLEDLDGPMVLDPWGNEYVYNSRDDPGWLGNARKDRFLVPLNSDFDLFSAGPDGVWKIPLTPPESHDDIVRANDGRYVGRASDF